MNQTLSPYDHGTRLEPNPWVKNGVTGNDEPRPASADDYGRVDFDNEEGATEFTVWAVPTEDGIMIRVDSMSEAPITVETETDRLAREAQVAKLYQQLEAVSIEAPDSISWNGEGEPVIFAPGHYILSSIDPEGDEFCVKFTYTGTNPYDDEMAVPTGLTWHTLYREYDGHGSYQALSSPRYAVPISEAETVVAAAKQWAAEITVKHHQNLHAAGPQQHVEVRVSGPSLS